MDYKNNKDITTIVIPFFVGEARGRGRILVLVASPVLVLV